MLENRYSGEYFDKETGTVYLRARYYNPRTSRWLSEDSARDGTNWYLYCYNNPLRYIDLTGLIPTPLEAAYMAQHVYSPFDNTYYPLIGDWKFDNFIIGSDTMVMGVYSKTIDGVTEYSLVSKGTLVDFGGKYHDRTMTEWKNNFQGPLGASKDIISSITKSTEFVNNHLGTEITFVGHSKGGAEAAANAVANNKNAIVFNPMSVKLNAYMSQETVSNYTSNMTSYVVKGDILNNIFGPISKAIDNLVYLQNQNKTPWYIPPGIIRDIVNLSNSLKNHSMESMINALKQAGIK